VHRRLLADRQRPRLPGHRARQPAPHRHGHPDRVRRGHLLPTRSSAWAAATSAAPAPPRPRSSTTPPTRRSTCSS
jgi:hypothetical protein